MSETIEEFMASREAWVEKGRPADMADPYWRSVVAQRADREAEARGYVVAAPVEPLVRIGA